MREYIADNYGRCRIEERCKCIRPGNVWLGRACSNWVPTTASTLEELRDEMYRHLNGTSDKPYG